MGKVLLVGMDLKKTRKLCKFFGSCTESTESTDRFVNWCINRTWVGKCVFTRMKKWVKPRGRVKRVYK